MIVVAMRITKPSESSLIIRLASSHDIFFPHGGHVVTGLLNTELEELPTSSVLECDGDC